MAKSINPDQTASGVVASGVVASEVVASGVVASEVVVSGVVSFRSSLITV